jgi:hypothetical protein
MQQFLLCAAAGTSALGIIDGAARGGCLGMSITGIKVTLAETIE